MVSVRARRWPLVLIALLHVGACSSPNASSTSNDADAAGAGTEVPSGAVSCTTDARVDHYAAGLSKDGKLGTLSFRLVESEPAPPSRGSNRFVLQILDQSGAPVDVSLHVDLKMPDHGHGTSIVPTIAFDADAQSFTVTPLYLFMPGVWRIDFTAFAKDSDTTGTPLDSASFFFCIEG